MFDTIRAKILMKDQLKELRRNNSKRKIGFCTGCYDILQSGHAVFFNQCKEFCDILVVGVGRDSVISQLKGSDRPVNPENNRLYLVASLQDVDFSILNEETIHDGKIDFLNIINDLKPDVFILNDDDGSINSKKNLCDRLGIELVLVPRVVPPELEATSTTRIIDKINFSYKAPLRIDFAGGWTDVPFIMGGTSGYVVNIAIKPHVELSAGKFNFSGYPRGSGLSTSTAAKVLEMISSKSYNVESRPLELIAEDLFNLENKELNWAIGRQDQYSIVMGGYNCMEYAPNGALPYGETIKRNQLDKLKPHLLLLHSGVSRNAQVAVEQVYQNYNSPQGKKALEELCKCAILFNAALANGNIRECAEVMEQNFNAQKRLAPATSNAILDAMYLFARENGAWGGKICGAGGGGAFIFICDNPADLTVKIKRKFIECFEIDFDFEYKSIKELNRL